MVNTIKSQMDKVKVTVNVPLNLPKLKKSTDSSKELPKLKLPKLKKLNG
jgi:predicted secreted Zn-dependent protease